MLVYEYKLDGTKKQFAAILRSDTRCAIHPQHMHTFVDGWDERLSKRLADLLRCPGKRVPLRPSSQLSGQTSQCGSCVFRYLQVLRELQEQHAWEERLSPVSAR